MRITFLNDIHALGGGEVWVLRACRYLASAGHRVSVVCPHRSELQHLCQQEGIELFATFEPGTVGPPFQTGLFHFLQEQQTDLIYCTVMGRYCEARVLERLARRVNRARDGNPMAIVLKSGLPPAGDLTPEYYGAGSGPLVRRLHTVAANLQDAFGTWHPPLAEGFVEVHYEGIDLSAFANGGPRRERAREAWDVRGRTVVSCVGRLVDGMKGQSVLLRAAPEVLKSHPDTLFLIAGEGEDRELLEELRDDLGLENTVRFVGQVEDVHSLLAATDVLCHPSLSDGMPNSIIEAMAMSLPVVASRLAGIPEVVEHEVTGRLVRANDVLGLIDALRVVLGSGTERDAMGQRGRAAIRERFELRANLDRLAGRLEEELAEFRAAPGRRTAPPAPERSPAIPVLFVMNVLRTGGEETELGILARYLDKRKFPLSVLCLSEADEAAPVVSELNAWNIPIDRACALMDDDGAKARYLLEKIRRDRIGIVVACHDTRLVYDVFGRLSPDECRMIEHGGIAWDATNSPKDRTARYVGVSREITAVAASRMSDPARALFIPSMVDMDPYEGPDWAVARDSTARWLRETLLEPNGFGEEACVVTFVGRLDPKKRVEDLLHAMRELEADHPEVFLLIVGGGDAFQPAYERRLLADAADLVERGRVAFIGPRSDVPGLLVASDILVLPSTGEGMAHVISEAGAAGLPVIVTDDGAAREQVDDGRCGVLIDPGDRAQLVRSLRELVTDAQLRERLGARLRERVRAHYAAAVVMDRWHALFEDVARGLGHRVRRADGHTARLRMVARDETVPFPLEIQIQTGTYCNATCVMCPHPEVKHEVSMGRMEESLYRKILAECADEPGLNRIEPFLMNEPFTDKRIVDWITVAKEMVPQADVTVTTNGALVSPAVSDRLVRSGLDKIWFSFNGADADTFEHIMGIPQATVLRNIDYLLSVRPESLRVYVNMIETNPMRPEIETNIRNWRRKGVEAGPSPLVNRAGNVRNYVELNYRTVNPRPIRVCELVFYKMYVLYNGDVVLCCMDWRRRVVLGNLRRQSIREVWQSPRYREIREKQLARQTAELELCSTCSYPLT